MLFKSNPKYRELRYKDTRCTFYCGCCLYESGKFNKKTGDYTSGSARVVPCKNHDHLKSTKVENKDIPLM